MSEFVTPTSVKDRESIKKAISDVADQLILIAATNDVIKDTCTYLKDSFDMPTPLVRKLAKFKVEQNFQEARNKFDSLEESYEILVK